MYLLNTTLKLFSSPKKDGYTEERPHNTSGTRIIIESLIKHLLFAIISYLVLLSAYSEAFVRLLKERLTVIFVGSKHNRNPSVLTQSAWQNKRNDMV